MTEQKGKKTRPVGSYVVDALLLAAIVLAGACLRCEYRFGPGSFSTNSRRDLTASNLSGRKWAEPVSLPDLPNLHKVSDNLYRGAQPNSEGMKQLEKLGVKTVINLRSAHSDRDELEGTALSYERISLTPRGPTAEDVVRFLRIVTDDTRTPVFVHCQYGSDRTGTMCAFYRIAVQGWSREEAIEEMTKGGFGFHSIWANLPEQVRSLDIDQIKRTAGLEP